MQLKNLNQPINPSWVSIFWLVMTIFFGGFFIYCTAASVGGSDSLMVRFLAIIFYFLALISLGVYLKKFVKIVVIGIILFLLTVMVLNFIK